MPRDGAAWRSSLIIGALFLAAAMTFSLRFGWIGNVRGGWAVTTDNWMTFDGGRYVWNGALGYVYSGTTSYALPLSFILMAPIAGLADHLGLTEGVPLSLPHPTAWLLVGPYTLAFGVFLLHAVRRLAWDLQIRSRLWLVQLAAVAVVLVPAFQWGHFEDVLALTAVIHALRRWIGGDLVRAALYISVAISFKQWAVMLLPFALAAAPRGRRLRTLVAAVALPAVFTAYVLGVDWSHASRALFDPASQVSGYEGHGAFFTTWFGRRTAAATRGAGTVLAAFLGWRLRHLRTGAQILAAAALILTIRPLFEPVNFPYYWSPGLLLAGLARLAGSRGHRSRVWLAPVAAVAWGLPRGNPATAYWWWSGMLLLLAVAAVPLMPAPGGGSFRLGYLLRLRVKTPATEPILHPMTTAAALGESSWTR